MAEAPATGSDAAAPAPCRNCGAAADGAYCPRCGQETKLRLPTLREFLREAAGRYVAIDGRFWRTVIALVSRPGFLTAEYLAGRRRRYIRPARLYLFATLIFFAVSRFFIEPIDLIQVRADNADEANVVSADKGFNVQIRPGQSDAPLVLQNRWNRFNALSKEAKADQLRDGSLRYAPYAMFALLPAIAALLKLLYLGRRRRHPRRPRLFGAHLVFAAHNHAFVFVAATAMLLVPRAVAIGIGCWIAVYLIWSMRTVYAGSWLGMLARAFVLATLYAVVLAVATAGLLVAAILLR